MIIHPKSSRGIYPLYSSVPPAYKYPYTGVCKKNRQPIQAACSANHFMLLFTTTDHSAASSVDSSAAASSVVSSAASSVVSSAAAPPLAGAGSVLFLNTIVVSS